MVLSTKDIIDDLRKKGHRLSKSRAQLFELILQQRGHWTIQDLADRIKRKMPKTGLATLYRTVSVLIEQKAITETRIGSSSARYEVSNKKHHDHLTCVDCGEIFEFENKEIERLQEATARDLGFGLADHRMEMYGTCLRSKCRFRKPPASKKQ